MEQFHFREHKSDPIIRLTNSDGDPSILPPPRASYIDADGNVNKFEAADAHTAERWKTKIANFLALYVLDRRGHALYKLWELPEGYTLWVHTTGPENEPRKDAYMYGCRLGHIFRSPAEFYMHAAHLIKGGGMPGSPPTSPSSSTSHTQGRPRRRSQWDPDREDEDLMSTRDTCKCKYCFGTPQTEITNRYPLYVPTTSGGAAGRAEVSARGVAARLAQVQDAPIPFKDYRQGQPRNTDT